MSLAVDLRERLLRAYASGNFTQAQLAELFSVGPATVGRWVRLHRETGSVEPRAGGRGFPPLISDEELPQLRGLVTKNPDLFVRELAELWEKETGNAVSEVTMWRALGRADLTRKKRPSERKKQTRRT